MSGISIGAKRRSEAGRSISGWIAAATLLGALLTVAPRDAASFPSELEMGRVYRLAVLVDNSVQDLIYEIVPPYEETEDLPRELRELSEAAYDFVLEIEEHYDRPSVTSGEFLDLRRAFRRAENKLDDLRLGWRADRIVRQISRLVAELEEYYVIGAGDDRDRDDEDSWDRDDRDRDDDDRWDHSAVTDSARRIERLARLAYLQAYREMREGRRIAPDTEQLVEALQELRQSSESFYSAVRRDQDFYDLQDEFEQLVRDYAQAARLAGSHHSTVRSTLDSIGYEIDEIERRSPWSGRAWYERPGVRPIDEMPPRPRGRTETFPSVPRGELQIEEEGRGATTEPQAEETAPADEQQLDEPRRRATRRTFE